MDIEKFGLYIFERRKQLGMTQQQLADLIGVTNKAVSKWERGQSIPDITLFKSIAHHLNVEVIDLLSAGDLQHSEQIEKKEVESLMEKTLETIKNINVDKVIKAVYISAMILLTTGLFTVLLIDYLLHQTMTWSLITTTAIIGTMLLFTVIRLTYKNMKHLIFGLLSTVLIISVPIVYSVGLYLNITDWVMTTFTPLLIGSLVSVAVAYVYFSISKSNVWIKVHISVIIIDVFNVALQLFIMNNKFTVIPNVVGLIVLLTTLPITINYTKNKQ